MKILPYFFARASASAAFATFAAGTAVLLAANSALAAEPVFKYLEWKTSAAFTLPLADEDTSEARAIAGATGLRLSLAAIDARCYWTLPKTPLATVASEPSTLYSTAEKARYGGAVWLFQQTLPLTVKAGAVSYARSAAKLRSPAPASTVQPLTKSFSASYGLGAALPTLTSSEQPLSVALALASPARASAFEGRVEGAVFADSSAFFCVSARERLSKTTALTAAVTAGRFYLEETSTLAKAGAGFASDWYSALLLEGACLSPLCKLSARVGLQQSPYGGAALWTQGNARLGYQGFIVDGSAFFIPTLDDSPRAAPLVGGNASVCRIRKQLSVTPQCMWLLGDKKPLALRLGVQALWQERVTATKYADIYECYKLGAGARVEKSHWAATLTGAAVNVAIQGAFHTAASIPERYYATTASYTLTEPLVRASVALDAKLYPVEPLKPTAQEKRVYALTVHASPGVARALTLQAGASATYKADERTAGEFTAAATLKLQRRAVRTVFKCAVELPF